MNSGSCIISVPLIISTIIIIVVLAVVFFFGILKIMLDFITHTHTCKCVRTVMIIQLIDVVNQLFNHSLFFKSISEETWPLNLKYHKIDLYKSRLYCSHPSVWKKVYSTTHEQLCRYLTALALWYHTSKT